MSTETEALERFFAAVNRNDMEAITKDFDPGIVRVEPEGFPTAGTYRGITEVQEHVSKGRGTWAEGTCDPEKFLVNGDKVVVYLHARVRLNGATDWVGGQFADGFVFRDGKITQYLSFGERTDALKWAGIAMTKYIGSCHCGGVRFEVDTDQPLGPYFRCNCSLCSRKGAVMGAARRSALSVVTGQDLISTYAWNTHEAQHYFCKVCGIYTHHVMRGQTHTVGLNMACIEGFDVSGERGVQMEDGKTGWSVAKDTSAA